MITVHPKTSIKGKILKSNIYLCLFLCHLWWDTCILSMAILRCSNHFLHTTTICILRCRWDITHFTKTCTYQGWWWCLHNTPLQTTRIKASQFNSIILDSIFTSQTRELMTSVRLGRRVSRTCITTSLNLSRTGSLTCLLWKIKHLFK